MSEPEALQPAKKPSGTRKRRGKSEGGIYRRSDGQWTGSLSLGYHADGRRKRKVVYGKTKRDVMDAMADLKSQMKTGSLPSAGKLTIGQFMRTWLDDVKGTLAAQTHKAYASHNALFIAPCLGGVKLAELSALHVKQFYGDLAKGDIPATKKAAGDKVKGKARKAGPVSPSMMRKAGVTLGVACQYAVDMNLILHNPVRDVRKPKHTPKEMTALDPGQVQAFLAEARKDRLYALYVFMIDTGARPGEAFGLQWRDIDWKNSSANIVRNLEEVGGLLALKDTKTKRSKRRIDLSPFALDALQEHRKAMVREGLFGNDAPVFCNVEGGWLRKSNLLRKSFQPILKGAGLPKIRVYDLRHTAATLLMLAGVHVKVIAERLGHSSPMLTLNTYGHVLGEMGRGAAEKMNAILRTPLEASQTAS